MSARPHSSAPDSRGSSEPRSFLEAITEQVVDVRSQSTARPPCHWCFLSDVARVTLATSHYLSLATALEFVPLGSLSSDPRASLSSFIDPLVVLFKIFLLPARHSHFVPHWHHPFAWPEHRCNRVIACPLLLIYRRSLSTLEHPSRGRRQRACLMGGPGITWLPHVSFHVERDLMHASSLSVGR